jgi:hypothetical protein
MISLFGKDLMATLNIIRFIFVMITVYEKIKTLKILSEDFIYLY